LESRGRGEGGTRATPENDWAELLAGRRFSG